MTESKDWKIWHTLYDNVESGLAKRLTLVQASISDSLPEMIDERYQIIDICSGDGRDLLDVLAHYPARDAAHSYLVEIDEKLAKEAERTAASKGLKNITIFTGDASLLNTYKDVVPADLILICGVFGNLSNEDIQNVIGSLAQLSKAGTKVVWTRNLRKPEVVTIIRGAFTTSNFTEIDFKTTDDNSYAIGTCEYHGSTTELDDSARMFTFIK